MMAAIAEPHASCVIMTYFLVRAQAEGMARVDIDGTDLFALVSALTWLHDRPSFATHADHLSGVIASAILTKPARDGNAS